jgi:hypothetical protein
MADARVIDVDENVNCIPYYRSKNFGQRCRIDPGPFVQSRVYSTMYADTVYEHIQGLDGCSGRLTAKGERFENVSKVVSDPTHLFQFLPKPCLGAGVEKVAVVFAYNARSHCPGSDVARPIQPVVLSV